MVLKLAKINEIQSMINHKFEKISNGLILIEYEVVLEHPVEDLLHWRIGTPQKPPLDVIINSQTGEFVSLSYFLQDDDVFSSLSSSNKLTFQTGLPQFETSVWKSDDVYLDNLNKINHFWQDNNDLIITFATMQPSLVVHLNQDTALSLLFNEARELSGFRLSNLPVKTISLLQDLVRKPE